MLETLLQEQIKHAYEHAPAIKKMMDDAGLTPTDIQSPDDVAKIPVTNKDKLQEMQQENPPFGGFLAGDISKLRRIYMSPGPIYDPQGIDDTAGQESAREAFAESGFTAEDIVLNAFMYHMVPAGILMDEGLALINCTVIPMGTSPIEVQIKATLDLKATGYAGTPSFLENIYSKAQEVFGVPPNMLPFKKAFFSAEVYTPSQRAKFEGEYGLSTTQAYATADLGIIGYEKPGQQGLFVPHNLLVQVCSPETGEVLPDGETGEVVVTSMNKTYPLIRFGTGDLSIMETTESGQKKLLGLFGRSGEAIKVRGMFLHPNAIKAALANFPAVKQIQAVVGREGSRDMVALHVIAEGDVDADALKAAVKSAARLSVDSVEMVTEIEGSRVVRDIRTFE